MMRNQPPRRLNIKSEKSRKFPRDNVSPRRSKIRPSIRDRLPRRTNKPISIKTSKNPSIRKRSLGLPKRERTRRSNETSTRRNDFIHKTKVIGRLHEREINNDLRPLRDLDISAYDNAPSQRNGGSKKAHDGSDSFFIESTRNLTDRYGSSIDVLPSRLDKRDLHYQDELFSRKTLKERHERFRNNSLSGKYQELDKYEKRFREISPFKKHETFNNFKFNNSSFSNPRIEKFNKYSHDDHLSRRNLEKPRRYDDDMLSLRDPVPLSRYKEMSPLRNMERYEKRKDWSGRLGPPPEKYPRYESPPKRYVDKYERNASNEIYSRRRDPEERYVRNELSPSRRRKYDSLMDRPSPLIDRHNKYSHNEISPRRTLFDKYNSSPPPPPPPLLPQKISDRHRRSYEFHPRDKPSLKKRRLHESPRENAHSKKHDKYADLLQIREVSHTDRREKYSLLPSHGEHSRSQNFDLIPKKSLHSERPEKLQNSKRIIHSDKRNKRLTELAHYRKTEVSRKDIFRDKPRSSHTDIGEISRNREKKQSRDTSSTSKKNPFNDGDGTRKRKQDEIQFRHKEFRDDHKISTESRDGFRMRTKTDRTEFSNRWPSAGRNL